MIIATTGTGNMEIGIAKLFASKGIDVAIGHHASAKAAGLADHPLGSRASMPARRATLATQWVGEIDIHFGFFLGWGTSAALAWIKAA